MFPSLVIPPHRCQIECSNYRHCTIKHEFVKRRLAVRQEKSPGVPSSKKKKSLVINDIGSIDTKIKKNRFCEGEFGSTPKYIDVFPGEI
jgi:hypothetical protein